METVLPLSQALHEAGHRTFADAVFTLNKHRDRFSGRHLSYAASQNMFDLLRPSNE